MAWGAAIAAGAVAIGGALKSGSQSEGLSKYQLDYQRDLANSAHVRQVRDLRNAGLNPVLSARLGGAGNVSPAGASIPDYGRAASTAIQAASAKQQIQTNAASEQQLKNQATLTAMQTETEMVRKRTEQQRASHLNAQADKAAAETDRTQLETELRRYGIPEAKASAMAWEIMGAAGKGVATGKGVADTIQQIRRLFTGGKAKGR